MYRGPRSGCSSWAATRPQVCNAGGPRALDEVRVREGSLLQPRFPAPLGLRGVTMMRLLATLNGLVNVAGGAAPAAHSAYVILLLRGTADGKPFLMSDGVGVGYGARPDADGIDAVYFVAQENYPVEFLELGYPVRLRRYGINTDSGGPGRHRGGCGLVREYEVLAEQAVLSMRIDGVANPPWGVAGGKGAVSGRAVVNPGTPRGACAGAAVRRQRASARRRAAAGNRRRRRARPPVRPPGRDGAGRRAGRVRFHRGRVGPVWRGDPRCRVDEAATSIRRADRPVAGAFHRREYVDALD